MRGANAWGEVRIGRLKWMFRLLHGRASGGVPTRRHDRSKQATPLA